MNFTEALEHLQLGLPIVREKWTQADGYLVSLPAINSIWRILVGPPVNAAVYPFTVEEYLATDWKKFDGYPPESPEKVQEAVQ